MTTTASFPYPYPLVPEVWPPQWMVKDGMAEAIPGYGDAASSLKAAGETVFPTLAGAILYGGVQASAFRHPIKAEPVYNGMEALNAGTVKGLTPVGVQASYKVEAIPGQLLHPPRWPGDL